MKKSFGGGVVCFFVVFVLVLCGGFFSPCYEQNSSISSFGIQP